MSGARPDHYAVLGLDRRCTAAQIRAAYRLLAKQYHPDLHPGASDAQTRAQELNAAHEALSNPSRRRVYDRELDREAAPARSAPRAKIERNIAHDAHLRIDEILRGTTLELRINDPANPGELEIYSLEIPPETAPGTRFRVPRAAPFEDGLVVVRVRVRPGARFKARGSDLRCELRISAQRARSGGTEMIAGPTGTPLRIAIPPAVARGGMIRIAGQGLPKPRGGRGDLLVRLTYRVEVRATHVSRQGSRGC